MYVVGLLAFVFPQRQVLFPVYGVSVLVPEPSFLKI